MKTESNWLMITQSKKSKPDIIQRKFLHYNVMFSRQENNLSKLLNQLAMLLQLSNSLDERIKKFK